MGRPSGAGDPSGYVSFARPNIARAATLTLGVHVALILLALRGRPGWTQPPAFVRGALSPPFGQERRGVSRAALVRWCGLAVVLWHNCAD